jgi:hypothetical protein
MDNEIPVHNPGPGVMFVGVTMIPAGETRVFPRHHVPEHLLPGDAVEDAPPPVDDRPAHVIEGERLAQLTVEQIMAELPTMPSEVLASLEAAEQAGKARKTLLAAIGEEVLKRASAPPA